MVFKKKEIKPVTLPDLPQETPQNPIETSTMKENRELKQILNLANEVLWREQVLIHFQHLNLTLEKIVNELSSISLRLLDANKIQAQVNELEIEE